MQNGETNIPEFGSVKTEEGFRALFAMSAYHHVGDRTAYPAVLFEQLRSRRHLSAQSTPVSEVSDGVQQAIMAVQQHWLEDELAGDTVGVLALCVDGVVWLPPNEPAIRGKGAVAEWLAALPGNRIRRIEITNVQIDGSRGLAYKVADFTTWLDTPGRASNEPVRVATSGCYANCHRSNGG